MSNASKPLDDLVTVFKWLMRFFVALFVLAAAVPFVILGPSDDAIILSSIVVIGVPTALVCLYILGGTVTRALWPAAEAILHLSVLLWRVASAIFGRGRG